MSDPSKREKVLGALGALAVFLLLAGGAVASVANMHGHLNDGKSAVKEAEGAATSRLVCEELDRDTYERACAEAEEQLEQSWTFPGFLGRGDISKFREEWRRVCGDGFDAMVERDRKTCVPSRNPSPVGEVAAPDPGELADSYEKAKEAVARESGAE